MNNLYELTWFTNSTNLVCKHRIVLYRQNLSHFLEYFYCFKLLCIIEVFYKAFLNFNYTVHIYTLVILKHLWNFSMTYTLLSVQWINSWWWTEELSETCRVSCQNKFMKLVHLVPFIIKKIVTPYSHTDVKYSWKFPKPSGRLRFKW
jgi:hypothetical protein